MNTLLDTERPKEVKIATYILWGCLFLTVGYRNYETFSTNSLYGLAINAYLYTGIYKGRNSARILALLLFIMSLVLQLPNLREIDSKITIFINFIQIFSELAAFYLLFTSPGKKWFSKRETSVQPDRIQPQITE